VVTESDRVVGVLTDRDIVVRAVADGRNPAEVLAGELSSSDVITVSPDDDVERVIGIMRERAIRRVAVVENGTPLGIASIGDLAIERDRDSALADISAAPANRSRSGDTCPEPPRPRAAKSGDYHSSSG
jgi:signal-transduction protein with cAMP-binding, CBS, and nucleotidyltransferase domain